MTAGASAAPAPIAIASVDPGCAARWWATAVALFLRAPWRWLAWGFALMLATALLAQIPLVGAALTAALSPAALGGWLLAAHKLQRGEGAPGWREALAGFRGAPARPLLALGASLALVTLLIPLAAHAFGADAVMGAVAIDGAGPAALGHGMLALLLLATGSLVASAALWFAPALVVLRGAGAGQAVRLSLRAVLDNGLTFLLYVIIQLLLAASASLLPWQAGWLVLLPVMLLTVFVSFEDVFGA